MAESQLCHKVNRPQSPGLFSSTSTLKHCKRKLGFSVPQKNPSMNQLHSRPFPPSYPLPPPQSLQLHKSTNPVGPLCQSLAGDLRAASENRHRMCQLLLESALEEKPFFLGEDMNGPSSPKQQPPVCSPFADSKPHASCLSLHHHHIWAGSPIAPVSPEPSNVCSQLWQGLGHTVEGPSPDLCPTQPLLCILPTDMLLFPFQWLCHANPPSPLPDVQ